VDFEAQRHQLSQVLERAGIAKDVREAMGRVPRHRFVPESLHHVAYADEALPIGHEQTISQPSLVGLMTERLEPSKSSVVLEVGTGSGYQTAILAELVRDVYTIEIVPELAERTPKVLADLGYRNIHFKRGDGYAGWSAHEPFDGIIITASAPFVPKPLLQQLAFGGKMIVPVENELYRITREPTGAFRRENLCGVTFVPMTGAIRN
jgi:protein-L-isoaspartate(D-aspartate) O-methyltransferase